MNAVSAVFFIAFVAFGLAAAASRSFLEGSDAPRRLTSVFIGFVLLVSFAAGLSQRDMWPFSSWTMMAGVTPPATRTLPTLRILGVDAAGNEYDIDFRAWQPLSLEELLAWMKRYFFRLGPEAQARVASYMLQLSNQARDKALSPAGLAFSNRWLGPLSAPTHLLHPAIWSHRENVPSSHFVSLRIYDESWDLEERLLNPAKVTRVLEYEYPCR